MAVLSGATASGRQFAGGVATTTLTTVYTAKGYTANVVSDSGATSGTTGTGPATAYIKEIFLSNYSASPVTVIVQVGGIGIINSLTINPNDSKPLSGLNTMMIAGATIQISASAGSAITYLISGVEIQ